MKKHLLFAAMLALGAAPTMATPVVNNAMYAPQAADDNTLATEEEYQATVKAIKDLKAEMESDLAEIQAKFPLAETYIGAYEATLNGEGGLTEMLAAVESKHKAGTLTAAEAQTYQETVKEWSKTFVGEGYEANLAAAEGEHAKTLFYEYASGATEKISDAEEKLPEEVADYFSSAMDTYGSQIQMLQWTAEINKMADLDALKSQVDALVAKAIAMVDYAPDAAALVKDIKATLPDYNSQIEKGKQEFPDFDWDSAQEAVEYWQDILKTLTDYVEDDATIYSKFDIEDMVEEFSYFKEENPYTMAQNEAWMGAYYDKYYPISQRINDITMILDKECPNVAAKYMTQLDDLNAEMTQAVNKFYGDEPVTKEEYDQMMARLDEIAKEVEDILAKAKEEQQIATGIQGVNAANADKNSSVYTLDGKRVNNAKKGLYIKNGKKVVLK